VDSVNSSKGGGCRGGGSEEEIAAVNGAHEGRGAWEG
jgi:hypothetical protein